MAWGLKLPLLNPYSYTKEIDGQRPLNRRKVSLRRNGGSTSLGVHEVDKTRAAQLVYDRLHHYHESVARKVLTHHFRTNRNFELTSKQAASLFRRADLETRAIKKAAYGALVRQIAAKRAILHTANISEDEQVRLCGYLHRRLVAIAKMQNDVGPDTFKMLVQGCHAEIEHYFDKLELKKPAKITSGKQSSVQLIIKYYPAPLESIKSSFKRLLHNKQIACEKTRPAKNSVELSDALVDRYYDDLLNLKCAADYIECDTGGNKEILYWYFKDHNNCNNLPDGLKYYSPMSVKYLNDVRKMKYTSKDCIDKFGVIRQEYSLYDAVISEISIDFAEDPVYFEAVLREMKGYHLYLSSQKGDLGHTRLQDSIPRQIPKSIEPVDKSLVTKNQEYDKLLEINSAREKVDEEISSSSSQMVRYDSQGGFLPQWRPRVLTYSEYQDLLGNNK